MPSILTLMLMLSPLIVIIRWRRHLILFVLCWNVSLRLYCTSVKKECRNPHCLCFYSVCWMLSLHWYSIQPNYLCLSTIVCVLCFKGIQHVVLFFPTHSQCLGPDVDSCFASEAMTKMVSPPTAHFVSQIQQRCLLTVQNSYIKNERWTMLDHFHKLLYSSLSDHVHILLYGGFVFFLLLKTSSPMVWMYATPPPQCWCA